MADITDAMIDRMVLDGLRQVDNANAGGAKKGWLHAIAQAMGDAQGKLAARMVGLSQTLSNLAGPASGKGPGAEQAAKEFQVAMTDFQATSQLFSMTSNASSTALKSIGEGMTAVARKQ